MTHRPVPEVDADARRLQLLHAVRRVDEAIERLDLDADATALARLREDLRAALRLDETRRSR
jgi:hypothetical protein